MVLEESVEPLRVVVADDEPIMQMYLEETLRLLGYEVVGVARDGRDLIDKCRLSQPDLIVTDIRMPGLDGYAAVREVCEDSPLPVLFISGYEESGRLSQAQEFCVPNYLTKPIDEVELARGIQTALGRFEWFQALLLEEGEVLGALQGCRKVQQAVARMSRQDGSSEAHAFERLRNSAETGGFSLVAAAALVLEGGEA
jgi:response regulator NasT